MVSFKENRTLIETVIDFESGLVRLSLEEYQKLPAAFVEARRIFRQVKAEVHE